MQANLVKLSEIVDQGEKLQEKYTSLASTVDDAANDTARGWAAGETRAKELAEQIASDQSVRATPYNLTNC